MKSRVVILKVFSLLIFLSGQWVFADFDLGVKYYESKNFEAAYSEFLSSARYGDNDAQQNLGAMYFRGEFVAKDDIQAYAWMALAAQNKEINRQGLHLKVLNKLNERDKALAQDKYALLLADYGEAALSKKLLPIYQGESVGLKRQKVLKQVKPEYPESLELKGESGFVDVMFGIDRFGLTRDFVVMSSSAPAFESAAIKALRKFQYEPERINKVPVDVTAVKLRFKFTIKSAKFDKQKLAKIVNEKREAAVNGTAADKFNYAYFLEVIPSFVPDYNVVDNPNEWYVSSAKMGSASANYFLGRNTLYGDMCTQDSHQSMGWLLKAAKSGLSDAQYLLAIESFSGARFEKSEERGFYWLSLAAQTSKAAKVRLAWLLSTYPDAKKRNASLALQMLASVDKDFDDLQNYYQANAAAYAESGDYEQAVEWQKKALDDAANLEIPLARVEQQLESYNNKKPWREEM